ncbi:MAG: hypothetical protein FWC38_02100 [Proteobacteria bacterium]|nr:hypothetical protein [Pseudomonadota bacterium]
MKPFSTVCVCVALVSFTIAGCGSDSEPVVSKETKEEEKKVVLMMKECKKNEVKKEACRDWAETQIQLEYLDKDKTVKMRQTQWR